MKTLKGANLERNVTNQRTPGTGNTSLRQKNKQKTRTEHGNLKRSLNLGAETDSLGQASPLVTSSKVRTRWRVQASPFAGPAIFGVPFGLSVLQTLMTRSRVDESAFEIPIQYSSVLFIFCYSSKEVPIARYAGNSREDWPTQAQIARLPSATTMQMAELPEAEIHAQDCM